MSETILIVDDEESVRRTFREWLTGSGLDAQVLVAVDYHSALEIANQQSLRRQSIDLAILDWNLGAGADGLQLLQDLVDWHPDIVAIMVTGYAHRATPLDALRMGVRDYLDKNQDLNRETFLAAVRRQLDRIRPAKRQRAVDRGLKEFGEAVEKVLPLVQTTSALNDPVPLPRAIAGLFRFVKSWIGAADGVLLVRHISGDKETYRAFAANGNPLTGELVPFAQSIAAGVVSMQEPFAMNREALAAVERLQPFERGRSSLLAAPLSVGPGLHVVMELFDKQSGNFSDDDRELVLAAAEFGNEILLHALAEREKHRLLFDAITGALSASRKLASATTSTEQERLEQPPPAEVMDRLKQRPGSALAPVMDTEAALELAEAIRVLALRHGPEAVQHCTRVIQSLREMLDTVTESA